MKLKLIEFIYGYRAPLGMAVIGGFYILSVNIAGLN